MSVSIRAVLLSMALAAAPLSLTYAAPLHDGPYVARAAEGGWIARWIDGDDSAPQVRELPVKVGDTIGVPAVGELPAFRVKLRAPGGEDPSEVTLRPATTLFVMADTHGEFEIA